MTDPTFVGPRDGLHAPDLPDHLFRHLCQIWTLCWDVEKGKAEWLGPTTTTTVAERLGLHRGTMWRILGQLRDLGWLDVIHLTGHRFRLRPRRVARDKVAASFTLFPLEDFREREDIEQVIGATSDAPRDTVQNPTELSTATPAEALIILLKGVGVGEPARSRIVASGIAMEKVRHHLERRRIAKEPLSYAVRRMLDGLPVPEYCRVCTGIDGQHRWVQDETGPLECPVPRTKHWSAVDIAEAYGENFSEVTPLAR